MTGARHGGVYVRVNLAQCFGYPLKITGVGSIWATN